MKDVQDYLIGTQIDSWQEESVQSLTFIVTADCNLRCKYCYITHKSTDRKMSFEVAKKFIDYVLTAPLKRQKAVTLDFIGGEPMLEIELIDRICDYFSIRTYELGYDWYWNHRLSICTNGVNYSDDKIQKFIQKNYDKLSVSITIDGTKEKHDLQRVFPDGTGSYDLVRKNIDLWLQQFTGNTKVTFASEDLPLLKESIKELWELGIKEVAANVVFENVWENGDDKIFENQLKSLADYIIDNNLHNKYICTLFDDEIGYPYSEEDLTNTSCGAGKMLAVSPDGSLYPCMRYYDYSLNNKKGYTIGHIETGIERDKVRPFHTLMIKYQSDNECLNCKVATGCSFCQGFNYDEAETETNFQRAKYICKMHKARVRANDYYFNKLYNKLNIVKREHFTQRNKLIFVLNDNYMSFCSFENSSNTKNKMKKEAIIEGLKFARQKFLNPIFLHSKSNFFEFEDIYNEFDILHIIPYVNRTISNKVKKYLLVYNYEDIQKCTVFEDNIIVNINQFELNYLPKILNKVYKSGQRVNINILYNSSLDLKTYNKILNECAEIIIKMSIENKHLKELNILTDVMFLKQHDSCGSGEKTFAYCPDGKLYICPAYYTQRKNDIGDCKNGFNIKNQHLFKKKYKPLCEKCNAYQCEDCTIINEQYTNEVNVSPSFQCLKSNIERNISVYIYDEIKKHLNIPQKIEKNATLDPFNNLKAIGKNLGYYSLESEV